MAKRIIQVDEKLPLLEALPLSFQHLFAMFGASVLVPILFGINPATTPHDLYRAILSGMAFEFGRVMNPLVAAGAVDGLVVCGGTAKNPHLRAALAAPTRRPPAGAQRRPAVHLWGLLRQEGRARPR